MNATQLAELRARWQAISERERQLVILMMVVLAVLFLWLVAIRPAWHTWREVPAQREALESQWLAMQQMASEAKDLKSLTPLTTAQSTAALQAATQHLAGQAQLSIQGSQATVNLHSLTPEQLRTWLSDIRQGARTRPVDVQLQRDSGNRWSGRVVLALPGQA